MRKKIKNSLSAKVFLWVFTALALCSVLIYGIVMAVIPQRYQIISDKQLEENAGILFSELEQMTYEEGVERLYDFCVSNHSAVTLNDGNSSVTFGDMRESGKDSTAASYAANIMFTDTSLPYIITVVSLIESSDGITSVFLKMIPCILAVIFALSMLSAWICSKVIVSPIARISQISRRMTELDMTWKCDVKSSDEIGVLSSNLNIMADRLQKAMDELEEANQILQEDIEKFQQMEVQRRNFFAAVSHELKTPLTILKGQVENMMLGYGDYQNHEKYFPQLLKTTEDMELLIREILSITKMEAMNLKDTLEEISLTELVEQTVKNLLPLAEEKQIRIYQEISQDVKLSVNRNLFFKAVSNVIGNAVRHSPCEEEVYIRLQTDGKKWVLIVENTGTTIPEQDIPCLFTPFYRADKSRNKSSGGSGLGLYITKTILDLHGMDCGITNGERRVLFHIKLPN